VGRLEGAQEDSVKDERLMVAAAIALALTAAPLAAQGRPPQPPAGGRDMRRPGPPPGERLAQLLELTDAQRATWEAAQQEMQKTGRSVHDEVDGLQQQMQQAMSAANPDPAAVGKLAIAIHRAHDKMKSAHDQAEEQLAATLTPEQRVKFDAWKASRPPGPPPGMGPGFGPPPPPPPDGEGGPDDARGPRGRAPHRD
jgi:Spy/CpxP family protein refolding chaperone